MIPTAYAGTALTTWFGSTAVTPNQTGKASTGPMLMIYSA